MSVHVLRGPQRPVDAIQVEVADGPQGGSEGGRRRAVRSDSTVIAMAAADRVFSTSDDPMHLRATARVPALANRKSTFDGLSSAAVPGRPGRRSGLELYQVREHDPTGDNRVRRELDQVAGAGLEPGSSWGSPAAGSGFALPRAMSGLDGGLGRWEMTGRLASGRASGPGGMDRIGSKRVV